MKDSKTKGINLAGDKDIFKNLVKALIPYYQEPTASHLFIVEGSIKAPRIGIRYPGYKLRARTLKKPNKSSVLWANIFDFEVVPFNGKKEGTSRDFTYAKLLKDFEENKKDDTTFWKMIVDVYENNRIISPFPKLSGIDSRQFLEMLKWMWIQEDFNYRLSCTEVDSPVRYCLQNKTGSSTSKGAGRKKFYAALILIKFHQFGAAEMRRIIP